MIGIRDQYVNVIGFTAAFLVDIYSNITEYLMHTVTVFIIEGRHLFIMFDRRGIAPTIIYWHELPFDKQFSYLFHSWLTTIDDIFAY